MLLMAEANFERGACVITGMPMLLQLFTTFRSSGTTWKIFSTQGCLNLGGWHLARLTDSHENDPD